MLRWYFLFLIFALYNAIKVHKASAALFTSDVRFEKELFDLTDLLSEPVKPVHQSNESFESGSRLQYSLSTIT